MYLWIQYWLDTEIIFFSLDPNVLKVFLNAEKNCEQYGKLEDWVAVLVKAVISGRFYIHTYLSLVMLFVSYSLGQLN